MAQDDLAELPVSTQRRIVKKIGSLLSADDPMRFAKPLAGDFSAYFRFRIGDYRVIFSRRHDGTLQILNVIRIGHRRDVYR